MLNSCQLGICFPTIPGPELELEGGPGCSHDQLSAISNRSRPSNLPEHPEGPKAHGSWRTDACECLYMLILHAFEDSEPLRLNLKAAGS